MKKFIALILTVFMLWSLASCAKANNTTNPPTATTPPTTTAPIPEVNISTSADGISVSGSITYYTFEEACAEASDVVVARFNEAKAYGVRSSEFSFTVTDRLSGNAPDNLKVYTSPFDIPEGASLSIEGFYDPEAIFFEEGKEYLLVLEHRASVYDNVDVYRFFRNTSIDLEKLENSTMYNENIKLHTTGIDFSNTNREAVINYARELAKEAPTAKKYAPTLEMKEIEKAAKEILVVKVNKCVGAYETDFRSVERFSCTVQEKLKGDLTVGTEIVVLFPSDTVKENDEVIVALDEDSGKTISFLVSRNSVINVGKKDEIISLVEAQKNSAD